MKYSKLLTRLSTLLFSLLLLAPSANAGLITVDLGNTATGWADGDTRDLIPEIQSAQSGNVFPFDSGIGTDIGDDPDSVNWLFSYSVIADTILSASFSFGIIDHDSAAFGNQVDAFSFGGVDNTAALNALFEGGGGAEDSQYGIYTFNLSPAFFTDLADGSFSVDLNIGGAGRQTALPFLGGAVSDSVTNGYHLIYSSLNITTQDIGPGPGPNPVPEPSTLILLALSLVGLRARIK